MRTPGKPLRVAWLAARWVGRAVVFSGLALLLYGWWAFLTYHAGPPR